MKKTINRYERKWVLKNSNPLILINSLIRSNLFFKTHYPARKVNSIYFDTKELTAIRQNLDGISEKKKIRVRWYGEKYLIRNPVIEIKNKKGFETKKMHIKIKNLEKKNFLRYENLVSIKDIINKKLKLKKIVYPILTTNYFREYFISANEKIRATVDYNLSSTYLRNFSQVNIEKNFNNICILELKYPTKFDDYVRNNLRDITLRLSKNSKFVNSAFEVPKFYS